MKNLLSVFIITTLFTSCILLSGCDEQQSASKSVYLLLDTSGIYTQELDKAQSIINFLLATLDSGSFRTDITGGILQAADFVNETQAGGKYVLILSDLKEELQKGHIRDFPLDLQGIQVVALNVTKLRSDNIDPREFKNRLDHWQLRIENGGGSWRTENILLLTIL
jgi:hypothetical protein